MRLIVLTFFSNSRPATCTGSHAMENGGAYPRSRSTRSFTVMPAARAAAMMSTRFAAPWPPTIWPPRSLPVPSSPTSLTCMGSAPG